MKVIKYSLVICFAAFAQMGYGQEAFTAKVSQNFLDLKLQLDELQMQLDYLEEIHATSMRDLNCDLISARQNVIKLEKDSSVDHNSLELAYQNLNQKRSEILNHKRDYSDRKEFLTDEMARINHSMGRVELCAQTTPNSQTTPPASKSAKKPMNTPPNQPDTKNVTPPTGCDKKQCQKAKKPKSQCCYTAPQPCPQPSCQKPCKQPKPCQKVDPNCVPPAMSTQTQGQPCPQPNCQKPCKQPKPCQKAAPKCAVPPTPAQPCPQPKCQKPCKPCAKPCVTAPNTGPQNAVPPPCKQPSCQKPCKQPKPCQKKCATPPVKQPCN